MSVGGGAGNGLSDFVAAFYMGNMFQDLLRRLTQSEPAKLPDADGRLALCALLVRIARTDGDYAAIEITRIDRINMKRHALSPEQAAELRHDAEALEREAPDTVRFTRAIKDAVPYVDREGVVEALWEIVLADGVRDKDEDALLRLVADLLGVNDRDSHMVRQRVQARLK
jgi:uncharacterized tellurite resistance protein B-like protein